MVHQRPKQRSRYRVKIGKLFYTLLRYYYWYFGGKQFARERTDKEYLFCVFEHKTPLLRKLNNLDMWMQHNKVTNLRIAAKKLNGIVIRPGETFSYWRLIGKPLKSKGYMPGLVLNNGKLTAGIGGGLCQLSNLIYWMTLHTPLTVTERYRHSYDVFPDSERTQPFGSGATCVYNYRDLQIMNNTDMTFQLKIYLTDSHLVGEWKSDRAQAEWYEVYEKNHCIKPFFAGGYIRCNELYRNKYNQLCELIGDEFITGNEALMLYQPYLSEKCSSERA